MVQLQHSACAIDHMTCTRLRRSLRCDIHPSITSSVGFALASTVKDYDCKDKGVRLRYQKHESMRMCMKAGDSHQKHEN